MGLAWIYHSVQPVGFGSNLLTLIGRLVIQGGENKTRQNKQGKTTAHAATVFRR